MGNSPGFPEAQSPYPGVRRFSDKPASKNDNFDQRWQRTKALALDLLSAICLIGGGHPRVLKAFGHFRRTIGESACFETIMNDFRVHEDLPLEQYNLEYSVACIQFINIVVHSPENINLRVYLQYSFTLLGLDDFLRALQARPGDKLNRHVDAYMNNMVNCSLLLDDAEAKEAAVEEVARLEAALEASESTAKQQAASFKQRDLALSELVESLRSKIRDINVAAGLQETANRRIQELEQSLAAAHHQIQLLQNAAETNSNAVVAAASETNSLGQVKPAPNPRQKKPTVCNMTTSTTLPMGFEFPDGDSTQLTGSPSDSRRKSMSLDVLTTTNQSTVSSSDSITRSSLSSSVSSGSDANYGTFSRKSGSITEKPRHGLISCTLISQGGLLHMYGFRLGALGADPNELITSTQCQSDTKRNGHRYCTERGLLIISPSFSSSVSSLLSAILPIFAVSDLCLARKTFANVSTNLSLLLSRLAAASYPKPPSPSPAVALPDWHTPAPLEAARLRRRQHRLRKPEVIGSTQCHQLAAILPDPWATCFASAHRTFKLSAQPVEDGDEAEVDSDAVRQAYDYWQDQPGSSHTQSAPSSAKGGRAAFSASSSTATRRQPHNAGPQLLHSNAALPSTQPPPLPRTCSIIIVAV
ncbi:unnamed protein product [Mesocestoides corti]|uniref:GBD/FH3 domain-containing protein n=1 Tax=Mesocestoides corti TaxID=53468 RepID=A0A158QTC7_MESCO|nr:unnamed protein product [Mesocestoides corti]